MNEKLEYHIFIGCKDSQTKLEEVKENELENLISDYFAKHNISFSLFRCKGGYLSNNGEYVLETTLCIDLIGDQNLDIKKLANGLTMYMNQECILVSREHIKGEYY